MNAHLLKKDPGYRFISFWCKCLTTQYLNTLKKIPQSVDEITPIETIYIRVCKEGVKHGLLAAKRLQKQWDLPC